MFLLGIDVGTSSIKVSVVDAETQQAVAAAQYPESEREIISLKPGWAEQPPDLWWQDVKEAVKKALSNKHVDASNIKAIGIAYQMHGLVLLNKKGEVLRHSIIWCDSRSVAYGDKAFQDIGEQQCLSCLLNSPGNFTASKLAWVRDNEPEIFEQVDKVMLPGDFIAQRFTGTATTTPSALSEGIFWNFKQSDIAPEVLDHFGFDKRNFPRVQPVFSDHGQLSKEVADELSLPVGIPVSYKAGDQPNNALSLNVFEPGEVAATAGTSGVIYGVSDALTFDPQSRVNSFAHVNHSSSQKRIGVLLCINGTGILNNWIRTLSGKVYSYKEMDQMAAKISAGSDGLVLLPFGNGAERMLNNRMLNAHIENIDFNIHTPAHVFRAAQEGIAFAFRYGLDIMRENSMEPVVIRAGKANMFLSDVFSNTFVNATNVPVELYQSDGSVGAALGAGIGAGIFASRDEAFSKLKPLKLVEPNEPEKYHEFYESWKDSLQKRLHAATENLVAI